MNQDKGQSSPIIGAPIERVDGYLKVTGGAKYSAEIELPNLAHAVLLQSTIGSGRIRSIDTGAAEKAAGVVAIITYKNAPKLARPTWNPAGQSLPVLSSQDVIYFGQHIGVVVAETLEQAQHASNLIKVEYEKAEPLTAIENEAGGTLSPKLRFVSSGPPVQTKRGDFAAGFGQAAVKVEQIYETPVEHHNPMEPHATTAFWEGEKLTVYDATQAVSNCRQVLAEVFGTSQENVRVISYFLGGGFGSKGMTWTHVPITALAAKMVNRPVKLALRRQQMTTSVGHRAHTIQKVQLGAGADGKLTAVRHEVVNHTSIIDEFVEPSALMTQMMYSCPNVEVSHKIVRLNVGTPTFTRAPGEASGSFALESAMDELAYALKMDPLELRLRNYAEKDEQEKHPFSSKELRTCYKLAADKFGWAKRKPAIGAMRDGKYLIGYGMASATYPANFRPASARAMFMLDGANGKIVIQCGTQDLGTGTYTIGSQVAAGTLGVSVNIVKFELGDTRHPAAPGSGGSTSAASAGSATQAACKALRTRLIELAVRNENAPLNGFQESQLDVKDGRIFVKDDPSRGETYAQVLQRLGQQRVEAVANAAPGKERASAGQSAGQAGQGSPQSQQGGQGSQGGKSESEEDVYSFHSFGAQFCEVRVDTDTGVVRVARFVGAFAAGKILNLRTATNQLHGGIVWGIGMALHEENEMDPRSGRFINRTLGDYHVPANLDVPNIEVHFVDEKDSFVNPVGVKGIGEIGIVGSGAAVANAVYHATGKRIRQLPLTPDKLI